VKQADAATHGVSVEALRGKKKEIDTQTTIQNPSISRRLAGDGRHASRPSAALEAQPLGAKALQVQSQTGDPKPADPPKKDSLAAQANRPDITTTIAPDATIVGGRPSTRENATSPLSTVIGSDVIKSEFLVAGSTGTKNGVVVHDVKVAADPDGKSSGANSAKIQLPPSPNKKRGKSSRAADVMAVERASPNTTEKAIALAIDALSASSPDENEEIVRTNSPTYSQGKPKATSPKPEDTRGNAKRQMETTPELKARETTPELKARETTPELKAQSPTERTQSTQTGHGGPAPKLSCIGSGDDDLKLLTSDDYDYGIDLVLVEKYENAFNSILEKYPEFMTRDAKMMEMLRVAKLQKILSVTLEVENELESHVKSLAVQKAEITSHYHSKLVEASRKRASREIVLQKAHDSAKRDNRVLESQMTWQLITMCDVNAKQFNTLSSQQSRQSLRADDPLAFLPDSQSQTLRTELKEALNHPSLVPSGKGKASSLSSKEEVDYLRQLEMNNALLNVQASVLERKLVHLQAAGKRHAWVESVFRRLGPSQRMQLKKRYEEKLGFTL
jgi:hypothetical protein